MSGGASVSAARAARLLVELRLRRLLNQTRVAWQAMRRKEAAGKRTATPGKARLGWLLAGFVGLSMVFSVANLAVQGLANMQRALGSVEVAEPGAKAPAAQSPTAQKAPVCPCRAAPGNTLPAGVLQAVALELLILLVAAFLLSLGSGDLATPDWDIEWLVTLPLSLATLLVVRIAERTFVSAACSCCGRS